MKLKYYLRGLGIGIIITTIILMISFSMRKDEISDEEVIERAAQLGMMMPDEKTSDLWPDATEVTGTEHREEPDASAGPDASIGDVEQGGSEVEDNSTAGETETSQGAEMPVDGQVQGEPADSFRLQIQKGDVARNVCETLAANGVVDDAEAFRTYLSQTGYASFMSVGAYDVPYNLTYEEIAQILMAGPLDQP